MKFSIATLNDAGYNIRNVFTDYTIGTAKQPCLVDKLTKTQTAIKYKDKSDEYFKNILCIDDTAGYALRCGRQMNGKFIICLDWDIYMKETDTEHEPTERLMGIYENLCGDNDGTFNSSTNGNYATLFDITDCPELVALCEQAKEGFTPAGYKLEVQLHKQQVIPPTATPCKRTGLMGKPRKFSTNKPFKVLLPTDGNIYIFMLQLLKHAPPKNPARIITPPPSDDETEDFIVWNDMLINGLGRKRLEYNEYLKLATVWKSNGGSFEMWNKWAVECCKVDDDHHVELWENCDIDRTQQLSFLEGMSKKYDPQYYKNYCEKKYKLDNTAVKQICEDIKMDEKTTKLTLDILNRGICDIVTCCYEKMTRLKYCKNNWYYCRDQTNLWECVKKPNLYIVKVIQDEINILVANITNDIIRADGNKRDELEAERIKVLKNYPIISGTAFQSNAVNFLCDYLLDNKFSEKLDANKGFLAFKNGIFNLKTGELEKGGLKPEHYLTFTLDYDYKPVPVNRDCEVWKQFKKVLNNNDDELDYFMSIVGHAFTGESTDVKAMYFMIDGSGESKGDNGKTFLFNIINKVMEAYVAKPKSSLLEKNNPKTHKQIVGLKGKRLVFMEEFPDRALNVDLMKELADGGSMENEIMFGTTEIINIIAMFFVLSNHTPNLDANESAGYNRYKEVSFCSHFDRTGDRMEENPAELEYIADTTLGEKIVTQYRDEVISFIIQYAMRYYKTGIPRTPMRFLKAEQKTKKANDEFLEWFETFIEGYNEDRIAEKRIVELSKLDAKKVRKGMLRLGYKYDKDLCGLGKDLSLGKFYKGGYSLEK